MAATLKVVQYTTRWKQEKYHACSSSLQRCQQKVLVAVTCHPCVVRVRKLLGKLFLSVSTQHAPKSSFLIQQGLVNIADEFLVIIMDHFSTCTCRSTYAENRHVILSPQREIRNAFSSPGKTIFVAIESTCSLSRAISLRRLIYVHFCVWLGLFVDRWWLKEVWCAPRLISFCRTVVLVFVCCCCIFGNPTDQLRPNYESEIFHQLLSKRVKRTLAAPRITRNRVKEFAAARFRKTLETDPPGTPKLNIDKYHELLLSTKTINLEVITRNTMTCTRLSTLVAFYFFIVDRFVWPDHFLFCRDKT